MTAEGGPETGETPRMLLIFEGLDADELIRPAQVAAVLTALDEIFLVTLLRDAPPPDHARREWARPDNAPDVQPRQFNGRSGRVGNTVPRDPRIRKPRCVHS